MALRLRRGTDAQRLLITPQEGELIYTTDTNEIFVGDGVTAGGIRVTGLVPENIEDLQNVSSSVPGDNDVLIWDALTAQWTPIPLDTIAPGSTLESLADVDLTSGILENGNLLGYEESTGQWQPTVSTLDSLGDVDLSIGNLVNGGILTYDSGAGIWQATDPQFFIPNLLERDLQGSVFADDSTLVVDGLTGQIHAESIFTRNNLLEVFPATIGSNTLNLVSDGSRSILKLTREQDSLLNFNDESGTIFFEKVVNGQSVINSTILSREDGLFIGNDPTGALNDERFYIVLNDGQFGIGTLTPTAVLDVAGDTNIQGTITASSFNGSVVADDSSVMFDAINNTINIDTAIANTFTGDLIGSVFSDDSTIMIDSITSTLRLNDWEPLSGVAAIAATNSISTVDITSTNDTIDPNTYAQLNLRYTSLDNTISDLDSRLSRIVFSKEDATGIKNRALITGYESGLGIVVQDPLTDAYGNERLIWIDGRTGGIILGGSGTPNAKLDVRGSGIFEGDVTAAAFQGSLMRDDSTTIIDGIDGTITASGFVQFGSYTDAEILSVTPANGMVYYNTTDNRFRGYQNGAWINLDDGTAV